MKEGADDVFLVKILRSGEIGRINAAERAVASVVN
jgi:hypothetical protein